MMTSPWFSRIAVLLIILAGGIAVLAQAGQDAAESTEHVVEIKGFEFSPKTLSLKKGDTVKFINLDIVPHTATAYNESFDTGELKKDEFAVITVESDELVRYFCIYHPAMQAELLFE